MTTLPHNAVQPQTIRLDEERLAWLALALSPGLGPKRILDAMKQLETPSRIFSLPLTELEGLRFPAEAAQFIFDGKARQAAEEEWERVAAAGRSYLDVWLCGVSGAAQGNLRPAAGVVGARAAERAEQAGNCGGGHAASNPLRVRRGGDAGAGPGGAETADCERDGAGHRQLRASRSIDCAHADGGGVGHGDRRGLSQGKQEACRGDSGRRRGDRERAADGDVSGAAEFSTAQPDFERALRGGSGGGGGGKLGNAG